MDTGDYTIEIEKGLFVSIVLERKYWRFERTSSTVDVSEKSGMVRVLPLQIYEVRISVIAVIRLSRLLYCMFFRYIKFCNNWSLLPRLIFKNLTFRFISRG
jgi:hypothetical protein